MNETGGTRADSYGSNHLADNNTVGSATGRVGNAASFIPANAEYLSIPDNADLSTGDVDFTIIANVYVNSGASGTMVIANKGDRNNQNERDFTLAFDAAASAFSFRVGNGTSTAIVFSTPVLLGTWHQAIAWHSAAGNALYIQVDNGAVSSVSYSGGARDTTFPLTIGAHADGTTGFNGRIDEVAFYKRVLTSTERTWFYNSGAGRSYLDLLTPITPPPPGAFTYNGTWTKYYFAGASRVASRTCAGTTCSDPTYYLSDHPSTSSGQAWAARRFRSMRRGTNSPNSGTSPGAKCVLHLAPCPRIILTRVSAAIPLTLA
jgi:hypothetical protein